MLLNVTPPVIDVITDITTVGLQDQLFLNVTPPAIDVITDVTAVGLQDQLLFNVTPSQFKLSFHKKVKSQI